MNVVWHYRWRLLASLFVVGAMERLAPWVRAEEQAWFHLDGIPEPRAGLEVDGSEETTRISGVSSVYDTLFIVPTVGLQGTGSIYHPDLLAFDFNGDFGWGWEQMTTTSPGYRQSINESDQLNRYLVRVELLQEKPYNATFFATQDQTYRDYGSFDTFTVDSTRYGGTINWTTQNLTLISDFGYQDETDTGLIDSSDVKETHFNFLGIYKRNSGQTTLTGQWNEYDNILNFGDTLTSMTESANLADSETFGSRQQITASTGVSVSHSEYGAQQSDMVNATENVSIHHRPNLETYLVLEAELNDLSPGTESSLQGDYGLRHQFYDSLTSTADVHGNYQDNSDPTGSSTTDLYGVGLAENYRKRLQSWGRLSVSGSIVADHVDDSASGGSFPSTESHQVYLPTSAQYRPVYLDHPSILAGSIQVTASGQLLVAGTDYEVVASGQLTEIRLIVPPSPTVANLLASGDSLTIVVTYQSASLNNASYEALTSDVEVRLDLFRRFGIYGRMNSLDNNAPPQVQTQTLTDLVGGLDYKWRWLRAGAEYEDYDSNFVEYDALRFFQNFIFTLDRRSTLSLDLDETFYHYPSSGEQTMYQFTTRYSLQLWSSLSCYIQGGFSLQDLQGSEQVNGSAQAGFSWSYGKLSVRGGYEYNSQTTTTAALSEAYEKDRIFLYLKRNF
jgi:hypothetical protein